MNYYPKFRQMQGYHSTLHPGDLVIHEKYGVGFVLGEWGLVTVKRDRGVPDGMASCKGIYDVVFRQGTLTHCCRAQYLKLIQKNKFKKKVK